MKKLLLLAMLLTTIPALAQYSTGILIILNNGDTIRSHYVGINNTGSLFRGPHIQLDPHDKKQRISIGEIQSIEGFDSQRQVHRYFRRLDYPHNNTLAERAFKTQRIEAYYFDTYHQSGMYGGGYSWRHLHYVKDGGMLQKATYARLKADLSDSPESMEHLKKANTLRIMQYSMYGVGTGLIVAAFHSILNKPVGPGEVDKGSDNTLMYGIMGAVMLRIPFFLNNPKQEHMVDALNDYQ